MNANDAAIVRRTLLFGKLGPEQIDDLVGRAVPQDVAKGRLLFQQGERLDGVPIVLAGWVRLVRPHADGSEATVRICGPAQGLVEAAVLLDRPVDVGAEAISDVRILRVDAARLRRRLADDPDVAFAALASASIHLRNLVADLEKLKTLSTVRRIAHFLVDALGVTGGRAELRLPYEKALIAAHIGMTAESFSRGLAKLRDHGVEIRRDLVVIDRVERLWAVLREGA